MKGLPIAKNIFFAIIAAMFWKWPIWKKIHTLSDFIVWHLLLTIFATIVVDDLISLVLPSSSMFRFYAALYAFEPMTVVWYVSNMLQVLLNLLILVPFAFYIYDKRLPHKKLWAWILIGKIFFDINGHYFRFLEHKTLFFIKEFYGALSLGAHILIWIPSYAAAFSIIILQRSRRGLKR